VAKRLSGNISASKGFWFGLKLLGQITGLLLVTAVVGWLIDLLFGSGPFGLAGSVIVGSMAASILVATEAYKVLK
jgi:F0F1-type ATP synthase assembly protein I